MKVECCNSLEDTCRTMGRRKMHVSRISELLEQRRLGITDGNGLEAGCQHGQIVNRVTRA